MAREGLSTIPEKMPASLTVCAIAHNEGRMLRGMLRSVAAIADEIVIGVDTRTTDNTASIASDHLARIVPVTWRDDFAYARNLTLDAATSDWILVLDADERLTPGGQDAVRDILAAAPVEPAQDAVTGIALLIGQFDMGGTLHAVGPSCARLFRNRPEIRYRYIIHEEPVWQPDPDLTSVALVSGVLAIIHYGYDPEIWEENQKRDRNIRLLERRMAADPTDTYVSNKLAYQRVATLPWLDAAT